MIETKITATGALTAGVLAALGAAICCAALLLVRLGVDGNWIARLRALEPLRPFWLAVTALFFGLAFWQLYRDDWCLRTTVPRSTRFHRRRLPVVLILLLLFSQFATAAYTCPNDGKQEHGSAAAMTDCEGMGAATGMDPEHPLLCKASCEDAAQSSGTFAVADSVQASALLYVLPPAAARDQDRVPPADVLPSLGEPPPGWPPLYLLNRVLRN